MCWAISQFSSAFMLPSYGSLLVPFELRVPGGERLPALVCPLFIHIPPY